MDHTQYADLWSRLTEASRREIAEAAHADHALVPSHEVIADLRDAAPPDVVDAEVWTMGHASGRLEWVDSSLLEWARQTRND